VKFERCVFVLDVFARHEAVLVGSRLERRADLREIREALPLDRAAVLVDE
jgi:hypothetical protein